MGFSERTDRARRTLAQRVDDLGALTAALGVTGPVVTVGHDWGGPISLGWALAAPRPAARGRADQHRGAPARRRAPRPPLIRLARTPGAAAHGLRRAPRLFVRTSRRAVPARRCPRTSATRSRRRTARSHRRRAVGDFVADIPLEPDAPEPPTRWTGSPTGSRTLADVPALLLWGPRDPVFTDRYLRDLLRPPAARPGAPLRGRLAPGHRGRAAAPPGDAWRVGRVTSRRPPAGRRPSPHPAAADPPLWAGLDRPRRRPAPRRWSSWAAAAGSVSFGLLHRRVRELAAGLAAAGVRAGRPGRAAGAAGRRPHRRGLRLLAGRRGHRGRRRGARACAAWAGPCAAPAPTTSSASRRGPGRWPGRCGVPGRRIAAGPAGPGDPARCSARPARAGRPGPARPRSRAPARARRPDAECAVVFTSGATGPAKGVVYRHRQVRAQLGAAAQRPTGSPPRTGWSPPSRRSRSTGRRWASPPPSPTWTSPRRARSPPPRWPTPSRPSAPPSCSPPRPRCATWWPPPADLDRPSTAPRCGGSGC